ncbi:MAG: hypothetical protein NTW67_04210 [Candidatus Woesearchaeota archaeon]|nr:hypothetical protein [Candidatus Woesearchaeota archaeon]
MGYIKVKRDTLDTISRNEEFAVDTNVIVGAAENNDPGLIQEVIKYQNCSVTNTCLNELKGLMKSGMFNGEQINWLESFILMFKNRVIIVPQAERIKIEKELNNLVPLLPRSAAYYVVSNFMDELCKKCDQLQQLKTSLTKEDYNKFAEEYKEEVETLREKCEDRYLDLSENFIFIPQPVEAVYMNEIMKFVDSKLAEMWKVVVNSKGDLNYVKSQIKKIKNKTYENDVRIVAESIIKGIETISDDSDVMWLFTLYYLRHATQTGHP